ncbi:MAG: hypothetical protein IPM74_03720 [Crocinitomicaceae bacterium]|nr:hypothetical protein [Crocinitomicaceae bacterium]MBK8925022.1 hypothetical protein [Crocinitomicaceae bacterium]
MKKVFKNSYNIVYVNCHKTAIQLGFKINKEDIGTGIIKFKIGASLWSFGENFVVQISEMKNETVVEVSSEGKVGLQIYDWGKNKENIEQFFETITEQLSK